MQTLSNPRRRVHLFQTKTLPVAKQRDPLKDPSNFPDILSHVGHLTQRGRLRIGVPVRPLVGSATAAAATFLVGSSNDLLYHAPSKMGWQTFTMPELRASIAAQKMVKFGREAKPSHSIWNTRLQVELGFVERRELPQVLADEINWCHNRVKKMEDDKRQWLHKHYEGFLFLLQVRNYGEQAIAPAPYTHGFASIWCGSDRSQAGYSIARLFELGLVESVERVKPDSGFEFDLILPRRQALRNRVAHRPRLSLVSQRARCN